MKKTYTVFYKSGNKVRIRTSRLTLQWNAGIDRISWEKDGNIRYLSAIDIEAIVEGKQ